MIDLPLSDFNITRFGSGPSGLPSRFEKRSFEYTGVEAVPEGLATEQQRRDSRLKEEATPGWRATIQAGGLIIAVVLIANIFLLVYAYVKETDQSAASIATGGNRVLFFGDCDTANNIKTWSHVGINILGTLLLVTSAATMQVLSAPTRSDIDKAHAQGRWLDVGLLSLRNLARIPWKRTFLWVLLSLSSIPLHLLYNSVIFSTTSGNDVLSLLVTDDFATNSTWSDADITRLSHNACTAGDAADGMLPAYQSRFLSWDFDRSEASSNGVNPDLCRIDTVSNALRQIRADLSNGSNNFTRMTPSDCQQAFNKDIVSKYQNVILVTTLTNQSSPIVDVSYTSTMSTPDWTCNSLSDSYQNTTDFLYACLALPPPDEPFLAAFDIKLATSQKSMPLTNPPPEGYFNFDHCLVQPAEGNCSVQLYPYLMMVIIAANIVKLVTVFYVARSVAFKPLVTIGDAVVEFMGNPDPVTRGAGPLELRQVKRASKKLNKEIRILVANRRYAPPVPGDDASSSQSETREAFLREVRSSDEHTRSWRNRRRWWFAAASKTRWITVMSVCWIAVAIAGSMLAPASQNSSITAAIQAGFGAIDSAYVLAGAYDSISTVLLANTPQIIISNIYVLYNGLMTSMLLTAEFMDYAKVAKPMRVSPIRKGEQRSTYYLQLPYRYSLPLMILMTVLHWLVSESFFVVHIDSYGPDGSLVTASKLDTIGYSAQAIIASVSVGALISSLPLILGFRRFPSGIPLVGNCSLAISAACHAASDEPERAVEKPLRFGVLKEVGSTGRPRVGFTSQEEMAPLQDGEVYDTSRCLKSVLLVNKGLHCCDVPDGDSVMAKIKTSLYSTPSSVELC